MKQNSLNCSQYERPIMTNQQGAPEALDDLYLKLHGLSKRLEGSGLIDEDDAPEAYPAILAAMNLVWRLQREQSAALVEAQQPAPSAAGVGEVPLPLLVRDIAADLGTTPIQVCTALAQLGFGGHSVNMAVTPRMAQSLRAHFASPTPQADSQPAPVVDGCTDPYSCKRCMTHPDHRGDMEHAGIPARDVARAARAPADSVTAPAGGNWIDANDVNRLVRELDVALNGEAGAAAQASLCDVVAQVRHEVAKRGQPLFPTPPAQAADSVQDLQPVHDAVTIDLLNERVAYLERKLKEADSVLEDAARLDFLCSTDKVRMIECEQKGLWRVYQDEAPPEAVQHHWQAIASDWHTTPRAAIDAAIAARKQGGA